MVTEEKNFNSLSDAVDYIISNLSDSEKDLIRNGDPAGIHLGLAGWVMREYVTNDDMNFTHLIYEKVKKEDPHYTDNPEKPLYIHPDNIAGFIIDEIIEKLKQS